MIAKDQYNINVEYKWWGMQIIIEKIKYVTAGGFTNRNISPKYMTIINN